MCVYKVFRRAQEPVDKSKYEKSYFNLLIEYKSSIASSEFPGTFDYLQVSNNNNITNLLTRNDAFVDGETESSDNE